MLADALSVPDASTAARALANQVRLNAEAFTTPISLPKVVSSLRARVEFSRMPSEPHGRLTASYAQSSDQYVITVKSSLSWYRRRFTIAHEIGHIALVNISRRNPRLHQELWRSENWRALESICDQFAAELLVPREGVVSRVNRTAIKFAQVEILREEFQVSTSAIIRSLTGAFPNSSIGIWKRSKKNGIISPRLTDWAASSGAEFVPRGISSKRLRPDLVTMCYSIGDTPIVATSVSTRSGELFAFARAVEISDHRFSGPQMELYRNTISRDIRIMTLHGRVATIGVLRS